MGGAGGQIVRSGGNWPPAVSRYRTGEGGGVLKSKNTIVGQKNNVNAKMKRKKQKIDTLDALGDEIITILTTINICLRYA